MKRFLVFLLLVGAGLSLLLWLQPKDRPAPADTDSGAQEVEREFAEVPVPVQEGEAAESGVAVNLDGSFEGTMFLKGTPDAPRDRKFHVRAADVDHIGNQTFDFKVLLVTLYDPDTGSEVASVRAARGQARILLSGAELTVDPDHPLVLEGAEATVLQGVEFAPLEVVVPSLEGTLSSGRFSSLERVVLRGEGVAASGDGLALDLFGHGLALARDGVIELSLRDGSRARLSSTGELQVRRSGPEDARLIDVQASAGSRLSLEGPGPAELVGGEIHITAEKGDSPANELVLRAIGARGSAAYRTEDGEFRGETAEISFGSDGRPERALLEGRPEVRLSLEGPGGVPGSPPSVEVLLSGAGPLALDLLGSHRGLGGFELTGPAALSLPDYGGELNAQGGIRGARTIDGSFGTLVSWGDVRAVFAASELLSDSLEITSQSAQGELAAIDVAARGQTIATGALDDGRPYRLVAREGLEFVRTRESFAITSARGVEVSLGSADELFARADEVSNLNGATRSLEARGNVFLSGTAGSGRGTELSVLGGDRAVLRGTPQDPARFEFENGTLSGGTIEVEPDRAAARTDAVGTWSSPDFEISLGGGWIAARRTTAEAQAAPTLPAQTMLVLDAGESVRAILRTPDGGENDLRSDELHARWLDATPAPGDAEAQSSVTARGAVDFEHRGAFEFSGRGGQLVLGPGTRGEITSAEGERVRTSGRLPEQDLAFDMTSSSVRFTDEQLEAESCDLLVRGLSVAMAPGETAAEPGMTRAIAGRMECRRDSILFTEGAFLGRQTETGELWSLDAAAARLVGSETAVPGADNPEIVLRDLEAWGGFTARIGSLVEAQGDRLEANRSEKVLRLSGQPVRVLLPQGTWESDRIEWDLANGFVRSAQGEFRSAEEARTPWTLRYLSLQPQGGADDTIQVMRGPVLASGDRELRAAWAMFWIDTHEWSKLSEQLLGEPGAAEPVGEEPAPTTEPPPTSEMPSLFGELNTAFVSRWLREVYLDGNIELLVSGDQRARAEAIYLDLVDGHGWLFDTDVAIDVPLGREIRRFSVHADWLRHSADGSLRADSAVMTACGFAEPHVELRTGDLQIAPHEGRDGPTWDVRIKDNAVRLRSGLGIPLPKIGFQMDRDYSIDTEQVSLFGVRPLSFGSDARFGTFVSTAVVSELGWLALSLHRLLLRFRSFRAPGISAPDLPDGDTTYSASFLGSRGGLLNVRTEIAAPDLYEFATDFAAVYDTGKDRGLIRVPEADRDEWRLWLRARGRFLLGDGEWLDAVYSRQSDPGVQAEFFESDYLRFEERESYLHWRRAGGDEYASATFQVRSDDFRRDVEELPSFGFFQGRLPLSSAGPLDFYYTSSSSLDNLRRVEGDPLYEPDFPDGLGEADVLRVDSAHRVEATVPLKGLGVRATPFIEGRYTLWDKGANSSDEPSRAAILAGLEFTSSFWKAFSEKGLHELSPSIALRSSLEVDESGPAPIPLDAVEEPLDGDFVDLRLRSLLTPGRGRGEWDLELSLTHAADVAPGQPDGWLPPEINTQWVSTIGGMLTGISHEGRYDIRDGETDYSRTFFGIEPVPDIGFGLGYHSGRDDAEVRLFNALSMAARWRATNKFEIEGRETFSTGDSERLSSSLLVRRYGHDFVFETELSFQAGEGGGNSIKFDLAPVILWKRPSFSFVDRWRRAIEP